MEKSQTKTNIPDQAIYLNESDVVKFRQFCEHYPVFNTLLDAGVLTAKNGQVVMDFDHQGTLMNVQITIKTYKRGKSLNEYLQ